MKFKLLLLIIFLSGSVFSQSEVFYFKDTIRSLTIETVKKKKFKLFKKNILDKKSNDIYWFLIPAHKTSSEYIFKITYDRYNTAQAYQNSSQLKKLTDQRYLSYQFSREHDVYIKVDPEFHTFIPIELNTVEDSIFKENNQLLLNGFYYGFSFLIIVYNLFYYFFFKDNAFLYYSLFLYTMCFGVFTMDGMLNYYNINRDLNLYIMVSNYILMTLFSSKFVISYLFLDNYYSKIKKYNHIALTIILFVAILFLIFESYIYLLILNLLVFILMLAYWLFAVLLFNKNEYTKILAFAYVIILFSAIDYFVLKFIGFSIADIDPVTIKVGAFFEMIILSVAVLYRMKIVKEENLHMRNEIVNYSKQLIKLTSNETQKNKFSIEELSLRERQIFNLIVLVKTNKEIANELIISVNTVKFHVKNIYEKLNIKSRREAQNLSDSL
jgi:DNA-binding CsgD family transcriptional regulator